MKELMYDFGAGLIAAVLLAVVLAAIEIGFRFGRRNRGPDVDDDSKAHINATQASTLGILALLLAFTFSLSLQRFDTRSDAVVDEANAIGTAYLRLDLLTKAAQPRLREEFRRYADARIALYEQLLNFDAARSERQRGSDLRQQIWTDALAAVNESPDARQALLLVPALNEMIDLTSAREAALRTHVPPGVFVLLVLLALGCAFFAGLGTAKSRRPSRLHLFAFAGTLALTAYVVLNLEFPRAGFVRLDAVDALLAEVRASMG